MKYSKAVRQSALTSRGAFLSFSVKIRGFASFRENPC